MSMMSLFLMNKSKGTVPLSILSSGLKGQVLTSSHCYKNSFIVWKKKQIKSTPSTTTTENKKWILKRRTLTILFWPKNRKLKEYK